MGDTELRVTGTGGRRRALGRIGIGLGAIALIALTWIGAQNAAHVQQVEAIAREKADAANQALAFEGQLRNQLLALDQTLRILERAWETAPDSFDIESWRRRTVVLNDLSLHVFIADGSGIIRASTRPGLVGVDVSGRDYFRYERGLSEDLGQMFIGPSTRGLVTKRLQMNLARRLDEPDGRFAGVIAISYDTAALTRFYREADLGSRGMVALVGTHDGQVRALVGPGAEDMPEQSIVESPMYKALLASPDGTWIGPSASDGLTRIHAFRTVTGRDLAVVVAFDLDDALKQTYTWQRGAYAFAIGITLFVLILSGFLVRELNAAQQREVGLGRERALLARANADLEAARARADRRAAELQATLAGMSDGVSVMDRDFRLVQWNDHFIEFTGALRSLIRVGARWEDILRSQALSGEFGDVDVEQEVARRMMTLRTRSLSGVVERIRPDGRTVELRRTLLPGGGYVTLYSDITMRKHTEDALRAARAAAEAAAEEKSRFVATVSHEIRAPLNAVLNSLTLLGETTMPASQRHMVELAAQSGDALLNLITDILDMSSMEAGRLTLRPSSFALRSLLDGVAVMFRPAAATRSIELATRIDAGVPDMVHTDPGRLRQVLINLVSNATKFAGPGQVEISAETRIDGGATLLRLAVCDQGPAISDEDRARLFQPFSRLDNAGTLSKPGTGLGLAICQRLAGLLGGAMGCEVTSEGGNGFWITLPLERGVARAEPAGSARQRRILPRTRILLVEDIEANQILTATLLRREGHCVDVAGSGEAALLALSRQPYDYVLMDIFMPGISGYEATRRLREMPGPARAVPVVALTANVSDDDRRNCLAAGMNGMLSKPIVTDLLLESVALHVWSGVPQRTTSTATAPTGTSPAGTVADLPSAAALDARRLDELRANLPAPMLERLVEQSLADIAERIPTLEALLAEGDAPGIEAEAHAVAGIAGGYALAGLDHVLRQVMNAAAKGDVATARQLGRPVAAEFDRARAAIHEALLSVPA